MVPSFLPDPGSDPFSGQGLVYPLLLTTVLDSPRPRDQDGGEPRRSSGPEHTVTPGVVWGRFSDLQGHRICPIVSGRRADLPDPVTLRAFPEIRLRSRGPGGGSGKGAGGGAVSGGTTTLSVLRPDHCPFSSREDY